MVLVEGSDGWWDYRVKLKILEGGILNTLHSEFSDTTAPLRNKDEYKSNEIKRNIIMFTLYIQFYIVRMYCPCVGISNNYSYWPQI